MNASGSQGPLAPLWRRAAAATLRPLRGFWPPLVFALLSLLALVVIPYLVQRRVQELQYRVVNTLEPARGRANRILLSLAREAVAIQHLAMIGDPSWVDTLSAADQEIAVALTGLRSLAPRLGPDFAAALHQASASRDAVRVSHRPLLDTTLSPVELQPQLSAYMRRFEVAMHSFDLLEQSVARRQDAVRRELARTIEGGVLLTGVLGILGLASALIILGLGRRLRRRAEDEVALHEFTRMLAASTSTPEAAYLVTEAAVRLTRASGAYIELVERPEAGSEVEIVAAFGAGVPAVGLRIPYPGSLTDALIRSPEPLVLAKLADIGESMVPYLQESCRHCSGLVVPVVSGAEVVGALVLVRSEASPRFKDREAAVARTLGDIAATAIRRLLLLDELAQREADAAHQAAQERALREAVETVSATRSALDAVRQIGKRVCTSLSAVGAWVEQIDPQRHELTVIASVGESAPPEGATAPARGSFCEMVLDSMRPVVIPNLSRAEPPMPDHIKRMCPDCSAIAVPLVDGTTEGVLFLTRGPRDEAFTPDDVEFAATFARLGALAFNRVRLLEESESARDELRRVMESRSRLMRGFGHDVKNPLGAADGYLDLMEQGIMDQLTDKQRESVGRSRRAVRTALELIDDLLNLARGETEDLELRWSWVSLRDIVRIAMEEFQAQASAKGLRLEGDLRDVPRIRTDAGRVRQILGNLLANAVKYTEEGHVLVRLSIRARERRSPDRSPATGGQWIAIDVIDTGPGIPENDRTRIFEEFVRLDHDDHGSGVGLSISRRLAQALGGDLSLLPNDGRGSTFTLWLPL